MSDNITCPSCGNVQPNGTEKCYKCGYRLNAYNEYLNAIDEEINKPSSYKSSLNKKDTRKNFYEISPQWQQYVDNQRSKPKSKFKKIISNPKFVIGFIIITISLGSFAKYAIDTGMFDNEFPNSNRTSIEKGSTTKSSGSTVSNKKSNDNNSNNNDIKSNLSFEAQNAYRSACDYLDFMAFSRDGLIKQLTYEGYSKESATEAVDLLKVDWKEQAARSAKEYLDFMALSKAELQYQLKIEGFTEEQVEYGVNSTGYGTESK